MAQTGVDVNVELDRLRLELDELYKQHEALIILLNNDEITEEEYINRSAVLTQAKHLVDSKHRYLINSRFLDLKESNADKLRHFRRANNRNAAVVIKDFKGQIIMHETLGDIINTYIY